MDKDKEKELVCIVCPVGCNLKTKHIVDKEVLVSGNKCKRGEIYAKQELIDPRRVITSTAVIKSDSQNRVPIKTDQPIPKELISEAMKEINALRIKGPVNRGDIVVQDFLGLGVNLVATKTVG